MVMTLSIYSASLRLLSNSFFKRSKLDFKSQLKLKLKLVAQRDEEAPKYSNNLPKNLRLKTTRDRQPASCLQVYTYCHDIDIHKSSFQWNYL